MIARSLAAVVIASAALAALAAVGALPMAAQEDARATRTPRPTPSATPGCVVTATHQADPARLAVGEETTATVHLAPTCSRDWFPLHVVMALDATSAVDRDAFAAQLRVAEELTDKILDPDDPHRQVGLVGFGEQTRFRCLLSADAAELARCRNRLKGVHNRRRGEPGREVLAHAITDAAAVLRRGRAGYPAHSVSEVMMVFTAAGPEAGCQAAIRAASKAKSEGMLIVSTCLGPDCDAACLRQMASSARYFFLWGDWAGLLRIFDRIYDERLNVVLKQLTLTYAPADGLRLVPGGADPVATVQPDGGRVDWLWKYVPPYGVTATLRLVPAAAGPASLAREAGGTWLDNQNRTGAFAVPTAEVTVADPPGPR